MFVVVEAFLGGMDLRILTFIERLALQPDISVSFAATLEMRLLI